MGLSRVVYFMPGGLSCIAIFRGGPLALPIPVTAAAACRLYPGRFSCGQALA